MTVSFDKYQGAGNDFVMIDNRNDEYSFSMEDVIKLCRPHFGIGSDGLIMLEKSQKADFNMRFFNPDGSNGMMCGNGGRCVAAFAKKLGIFEDTCTFEAPDGIHHAKLINGDISLRMVNPHSITFHDDGIYMNTGTSHFVRFVEDLENIDVEDEGRKLRHDKRFDKYSGCNANFVKKDNGVSIHVRTYERGVERETLACGTGVCASCIAFALQERIPDGKHSISVHTRGGDLKVEFCKQKETITDVWLQGKGEYVFSGTIPLD